MKSIFLVFVAMLFFSACGNDKEKDDAANVTEQTNYNANSSQNKDVNFSLYFNDGDSLFIKSNGSRLDFKNDNKAILFSFFTTWCVPCIAEIPHLNKLQDKFKNELVIIGVLFEDKSDEEIEDFIKENKITYKIAKGENNYLLAKVLGGINGIPTLFLYTTNGKLFNQYLGLIPEEMLYIDIVKASS
ncbi:TlpA disulfide reductase family protein [Campylobacter sp. MIT 21-1685]|uniref:TlpA family protein disulfide reductase n=1 Tax=unclassified Campylobacter TaxID=2593542 RepID=UPI00224ABE87|nr:MULTISPECIES: TlpA disulfide reductase family protein [unclassified Campylobacter]MCX2682546.1 TlpA disulfide reductase family protein [Campylobacter sp. MIT 21-1684]MCX2750741.1 TlpA disulfide reductase family protein [Campylobacter sp. MIT 21-1682]MCX2807027.1 TlpA disulfide reductase family protein [Campylobacter sp. MIT 21-1685]